MTRWEALVRFDDEIREAAAKLIPFGPLWVARLGEAFLALHEDRRYLPNIVARLTEEAAVAALEAERAEAIQWLETFSTIRGERTSKEALAVLIELRARGYLLEKDQSGSIAATIAGRGTSFVFSNEDILRLGSIALRNPRE
jgi:hypothetical protein